MPHSVVPLFKYISWVWLASSCLLPAADLVRIKYNHPRLVVDLGVGLWAWPMPVDWDGDGDLDLLVDCPCKPYNGIWFFENPGGSKTPVFKAGKRVHASRRNIQVSLVDGKPRYLTPGTEVSADLTNTTKIYPAARVEEHRKIRANQWKYVDYDGDGALDLIAAVGIWDDYGWDNAYNAKGEWTNGPLRGFVYLMRNEGTTAKPKYAAPTKVRAGGKAVDVYGRPSPNFADFDGDGDLDLLCGEFVDSFTYFENTGTRRAPKYSAGRKLTHNGKTLTMDLEMIMPSAVDWDGDGDVDLIVGDEDGRVALVEHTGKVRDGLPQFLPPVYFKQQADEVKFGALSTPAGFDWDGDGDEDIICGNTAGYIAFIENLSGPKVERPRWAAPQRLKAGGKTLRIMAGPNGSIQGPCERKWGYTTQTVADWDHDGRPDIVVNSILGKIVWYRNIGTRKAPKLSASQPINVEWRAEQPALKWGWMRPSGKALLTQWRTTPVIVDWNRDGLNDLLMLDHEGYLMLFPRSKRGGKLLLHEPQRIFETNPGYVRLNSRTAGGSGRRKLCVVDWDGDGRLDVLANSPNAELWQNVADREGMYKLLNRGTIFKRNISSHTTSPTVVDWNGDGVPDLLVGAEDGFLYYGRNPRK
ncbi:MAG: VCBS repeat-containing protein [Verrucomicrobiales bacterium]|nr:VCBS repeat-containing protein [Verrucomicrobiales bacterium]MBT5846319.1 VCBS repeat-containing protein [Verrucomicrobiales bacterium]